MLRLSFAQVQGRAGSEDSAEMQNILIDGKRLKDISDLPLDQAV
ncbi:MAG: hypothetical protein II949_05510 [Prevotella sp.]|nr:hypothetical protein [Prevotella sp.]